MTDRMASGERSEIDVNEFGGLTAEQNDQPCEHAPPEPPQGRCRRQGKTRGGPVLIAIQVFGEVLEPGEQLHGPIIPKSSDGRKIAQFPSPSRTMPNQG